MQGNDRALQMSVAIYIYILYLRVIFLWQFCILSTEPPVKDFYFIIIHTYVLIVTKNILFKCWFKCKYTSTLYVGILALSYRQLSIVLASIAIALKHGKSETDGVTQPLRLFSRQFARILSHTTGFMYIYMFKYIYLLMDRRRTVGYNDTAVVAAASVMMRVCEYI